MTPTVKTDCFKCWFFILDYSLIKQVGGQTNLNIYFTDFRILCQTMLKT